MTIDPLSKSLISYIVINILLLSIVGIILMCKVIKNKLEVNKDNSNGQSLKASAVESVTDAAFGFLTSWFVMFVIIPMIYPNFESSASQSFGIVTIFTTVSIIRRFITRRIFNVLSIIGFLK